MLRYLVPLGIIALIATSAWWLDAKSHAPAHRTHPAGTPKLIYAAGRVEGLRPESSLRPWEHGRVMRVMVQEGQIVEANEVLLELDDSLHRIEEAVAAADLQRAKAEFDRLTNGARREERAEAAAQYHVRLAQLEQSRLTWKRTESLHADGVVSHQQADNDRTQLVRLEAEVAAAKARLQLIEAPARQDELRAAQARTAAAKAKLDLAQRYRYRRQLRAPFAGRILKVNVEEGEMAGPQSAQPVMIIADTSRFRVRAYVEEMEAPLVQIGMPAVVTTAGLPGVTLRGQVTRISPRMGAKQIRTNSPTERYDTKTREVWIDLENGEQLVVGLRVDVMIQRQSDSPPVPGPPLPSVPQESQPPERKN